MFYFIPRRKADYVLYSFKERVLTLRGASCMQANIVPLHSKKPLEEKRGSCLFVWYMNDNIISFKGGMVILPFCV